MILTLDPSLNGFGWAVIDESTNIIKNCGCIQMPASKRLKIKTMKDKVLGKFDQDSIILSSIFKKLDDLVKTYNIKTIFSEVPIGSQSSRAAEALGMVKGLVVSLSIANGALIYPVSPSKIKEFLTTDRNADKEVIYGIVMQKLPSFGLFFPNLMTIKTRHAISDALSVYLSTLDK